MPAACWGCEWGVAPVGVSRSALPLDPLGACWECHVFGCRAHGERDAGSGKWLCYPSVATALAVSAGVEPAAVTATRFADSWDFQQRFAQLAEATAGHRTYWRSGPGEARLGAYRQRPELRETRWDLVADAIGVGAFLLAREPQAERADAFAERGPPAAQVLPPSLATMINELANG
jgi:hypothetical protein